LEDQLSFANHLFEEEDYFRAITEYKRFIFLSQNQEKRQLAQKRIFSSYKKANRYTDALNYLNEIHNEMFTTMESGKLCLLTGEYRKARMYFQRNNSDTAKILLGWSYMKEADWKKSKTQFFMATNDPNIQSVASILLQYSDKAEAEIRQKNVSLSALLSTVIPGAGRFYTNRPGDGLFSFLTVAIPGVISYFYWKKNRKRAFSIALGTTAIFYLGDIYGSVISAQEYNRVSKQKYLEKIEDKVHIEEELIK